MKKLAKQKFIYLALVALAFTACKKTEKDPDGKEAFLTNGAVGIAASQSVVGVQLSKDSIYAIGALPKDQKRTNVMASGLSAAITTYLTTNYPGYTFNRAFSTSLKTATTINSFVVAINFNGKPVALRFLADGTFRAVLELREGEDIKKNRDNTVGGVFENRNATRRDSVALSALLANIRTHMTTTFPRDTLKAAWKNKDGSIVLLSKNVTFFGNTFTPTGTFIQRTAIASPLGRESHVLQAALPATVTGYLSTTYPNYVFGRAFVSSTQANVARGYLVVFDANLTKYAVVFDNNGAFVSVRVLR